MTEREREREGEIEGEREGEREREAKMQQESVLGRPEGEAFGADVGERGEIMGSAHATTLDWMLQREI